MGHSAKMKRSLFLLLLAIFVRFASHAEVIPNSLFGDNAVLQREQRLPVWGTAANGETVTVEFAGQAVSTLASNGNWRVWLKPLSSGGPFGMKIRGEDGKALTLTNIL